MVKTLAEGFEKKTGQSLVAAGMFEERHEGNVRLVTHDTGRGRNR